MLDDVVNRGMQTEVHGSSRAEFNFMYTARMQTASNVEPGGLLFVSVAQKYRSDGAKGGRTS
jgi:hypothetical protein